MTSTQKTLTYLHGEYLKAVGTEANALTYLKDARANLSRFKLGFDGSPKEFAEHEERALFVTAIFNTERNLHNATSDREFMQHKIYSALDIE